MIAVCEKQAKFVELFESEPAIDKVFQIRAGKYRRYAGLKWYKRAIDAKTGLLNVRDAGRTLVGYTEARRLLKRLKPDIMLIKGGFVGVPMGVAASRLGIPFITHDSDSTPGLANRIIARWATKHATGLPKELYNYPAEDTVYTGIPVSEKFKMMSPKIRTEYRDKLGLGSSSQIITVIGGSQGAGQLNHDMVSIVGRLMQKHKGLGLVHIAGKTHEAEVSQQYDSELLADERHRVVVRGFVTNPEVYTGAADIVVTRASATVLAEISLQSMPAILVPGRLAGAHQNKNAVYFRNAGAAEMVEFGDQEGLLRTLDELLSDPHRRESLGNQLGRLAKPNAAHELAALVYRTAGKS